MPCSQWFLPGEVYDNKRRETTAIKACFYFQAFLFYWRIIYGNKSLKCKKALNLQFKKRFIQQFNDSTMFFKHAEITVPSIAIKSTSFFMSERRRQTMSHLSRQGCFVSQLLSLSITDPWILNLSLTFSRLCLSVWLHVCTDFSKVTHYSRPLSLALIWSVQSGKTHSSISSQAVSDLFQLCLCVSAGCHYAADHITSMWNQTQGEELNSIRDNWNCLQHKWPLRGYKGISSAGDQFIFF